MRQPFATTPGPSVLLWKNRAVTLENGVHPGAMIVTLRTSDQVEHRFKLLPISCRRDQYDPVEHQQLRVFEEFTAPDGSPAKQAIERETK